MRTREGASSRRWPALPLQGTTSLRMPGHSQLLKSVLIGGGGARASRPEVDVAHRARRIDHVGHLVVVRCLRHVRSVRREPALAVVAAVDFLLILGAAHEAGRAALARDIAREEILLVWRQEGTRVGRVACLPLPRGAAQYEHVAGLHKLLRGKHALLGELRLGQHRRYVLGRAERGVAPVLPGLCPYASEHGLLEKPARRALAPPERKPADPLGKNPSYSRMVGVLK